MKLNQKNRGSILLVATLMTFLTFLSAFTLFKVLPVEFNAAQKSRMDLSAHYTAEAGVKEAIVWIESQAEARTLSDRSLQEFNSQFGRRADFIQDWAREVRIERIERDHFGITSEAFFRNRKVREVKAQVSRDSFSLYALFIDQWPFDGPDETPLVFTLGENLVQGPFHTNDFFVLAHQDSEGFGEGGGEAFVSGPYAQMTHSTRNTVLNAPLTDFVGDGNAYVTRLTNGVPRYNNSANHVPFDADGPISQRYDRIVEGGRAALSYVDPIAFPNIAEDGDGTPLREKARGIGNPDFQGDQRFGSGVQVPANSDGEVLGGVYIVGDSEITLSVDAQGNAVQSILQTHLAEAYFETETVEVTSPRYISRPTFEQPAFVDEVRLVPGVRRVVVGEEIRTVTTVDGITQPVVTPVYGEEPITVQEIVSVPYDPEVHGEGPWTEYVEDVDNPYVYQTIVMHPISEEEFDETNPRHSLQYQETGERSYTVVEVTSESGYPLPQGREVEGVVTSGTVPRDHTVYIDHAENRIVVSRGNLNGVTFCDGNIESLSGVNKGAMTDGPQGHNFGGRTIVAAPEFGYKMQITGNIRQFSADSPNQILPTGEVAANAHHALGLIAHDVEMAPDYQTSEGNPLVIYAVVLAGASQVPIPPVPGQQIPNDPPPSTGGFGTHSDLLSADSRLGLGRFELYGGVIEANARPWFTAPGGILKGLEGDLTYDPAAAANLQNFPSTSNMRVLRYSEYADFD